jgi:hypothetical protein
LAAKVRALEQEAPPAIGPKAASQRLPHGAASIAQPVPSAVQPSSEPCHSGQSAL